MIENACQEGVLKPISTTKVLYVYLKVEGYQNHQQGMMQVYTIQPLNQVMHQKTIIEYPTLFIYTRPPF